MPFTQAYQQGYNHLTSSSEPVSSSSEELQHQQSAEGDGPGAAERADPQHYPGDFTVAAEDNDSHIQNV